MIILSAFRQKERGVGLIEILVVVSIISLALASLAGLGNFALKIQHRLQQNTIATFWAQEAIEATRAIKDGAWSDLTAFPIQTALHPLKTPSFYRWTLESGNENQNGFTRYLTISPVYRDDAFNIVASGGTLDANSKKVTVVVTWNDNGQNQQVSLTDYLMNWEP